MGHSDILTEMGLTANIKATIYASFAIMCFVLFLGSMICGFLQKDTHEIIFPKKAKKK